jgi:hypothetical protein
VTRLFLFGVTEIRVRGDRERGDGPRIGCGVTERGELRVFARGSGVCVIPSSTIGSWLNTTTIIWNGRLGLTRLFAF